MIATAIADDDYLIRWKESHMGNVLTRESDRAVSDHER